MNAPSRSLTISGPAALLVLFAAGGLLGRALALPLPAAVVGLALALLALRLGVMFAALAEPAPTPTRPIGQDTNGPSLRAANG